MPPKFEFVYAETQKTAHWLMWGCFAEEANGKTHPAVTFPASAAHPAARL